MFSCNLCVTLQRDIMIKAEEAEEQTVKFDIDPKPSMYGASITDRDTNTFYS